jgi:hypothetical protein
MVMVKRNQAPSAGPSQATVDACEKLIAQVRDRVAPGDKPLTAKERRRTLKLRRGGHGTARSLAAIAAKSGVGSAVPVEQMLRDVEYAERLQGLAHDVTNLGVVLGDLILQADGRAWKVAVKAYSVLKRFAADDPTIEAQLEPIIGAFATKGRGKNAARGKKPADKPAAPNVSPQG